MFKSNTLILLFIFCSIPRAISGIPETEVMILSGKVGTEIDEHENRFYRIFPKEKGFVNAQILRINEENYRVVIVKEIRAKQKTVKRFISQEGFDKLKAHVDSQPEFTEEAKIAMYEGLDFLRVEKIINEIPKPQFVILKHSGQKVLKGSLFLVNDLAPISTSFSGDNCERETPDPISNSEVKTFSADGTVRETSMGE